MIAIIWICMVTLSVFTGVLHGQTGKLTPAALEGAQSAISLCISLSGALCLWSGLAKVMEKAGLTEKLGKVLRPLFRKLFPIAAQDPLALGYITANVSANLLGLGNAATPMGIAAVKRMHKLQGGSSAGDEMCRLIVMNTASIQLFPTTVGAVRAACGARAPFDILPAVWITSLCSVGVGLLAARILQRAYA
ncbi:MAG: spore maturation protein A [Oscillospiraceae bacterium]|nr:spore maturation protein A [Oscillospiraceae bacterium]